MSMHFVLVETSSVTTVGIPRFWYTCWLLSIIITRNLIYQCMYSVSAMQDVILSSNQPPEDVHHQPS